VNIQLFKVINAFNSCYRQPKKQLEELESLKGSALTEVELLGESLELEFLGSKSKVHPVKVLFDAEDSDLIKGLENYDKRKDKCHLHCLQIANYYPGECSVLTGFMYGYTNKTKYLHSVLRLNVGGKPGIIDTSMNSLMTQEFYNKLTDFEVLTEISSSTIKQDFDLIAKTEKPCLREYFLHRDEYVKELELRLHGNGDDKEENKTENNNGNKERIKG
ncbi:MAG: hypothetical protein K2K31_03295, partial [Clostridia bacterium]|nr:hypothetical protein [Clostridia bacterium]